MFNHLILYDISFVEKKDEEQRCDSSGEKLDEEAGHKSREHDVHQP